MNADIIIKNADSAISICGDIVALRNSISNEIAQLTDALNEVKSNWESSGLDRQSYVSEMEKAIKELEVVINALSNVSGSARNYAVQMKTLAQKTVA